MRAVGYIRVSDSSQVEGHSRGAQERMFRESCQSRGWEPAAIYREEGKSAHVDSIKKRPVLRRLLEDAARGEFDVVVVHTLDRWSRNAKVALESLATLARHNVALVSITENIDYSTAHGKLLTTMLAGFAEFFSDSLGTHVKKGISERAQLGRHLGGIPFGYASCVGPDGQRCDPEHPGGVHLVEEEAKAVGELYHRYAGGTTTLSQQAAWLNQEGFRTRNMHQIKDGDGSLTGGPRMFTVASVRGTLHNPFYTGNVKRQEQLLPGAHEPLISMDVFQAVQAAMKRNSGRSKTLSPHPEREYLLKGLIRCAHCSLPMWAQTFGNGNRYYREQKGSRGGGYCVGRSGSMACQVPDGQIGQIVEAIILPDAWMDRMLSRLHLADELKRIKQDRKRVEEQLRRLREVYLEGDLAGEEYRLRKQRLEDQLGALVVPGIDAAKEAAALLENLPALWEQADLTQRHKLLRTMLDAVYVDTVEEKSIVAIRPKPAFRPLFEIATTREGSDVVLINVLPLAANEPEAADLRSWWRRGRVELPVQKVPWLDMLQACSAL